MKIAALHVSPGHNFFGHHGGPPGGHPTLAVTTVDCVAGQGLRGDRFVDRAPDQAGQVTFFAEEVHRALLAALQPAPFPSSAYRRNILTRGVDLNTLVDREFTVQGVRFLGGAECRPCYWMDQAAAPGAEAWLRGRGGLRAKVLCNGALRVDCATAGAVLLAGGRGRRMGADKAGLDWRGRPLGEHQAATLAATGAWPLTLACRADQPWTPRGFGRLEDRTDGGALGALASALAAAVTPVTIVLAVDLPEMTADLLADVAGQAREQEVSVVPVHANTFEPFGAAWHRSALPALEAAAAEGRSLQAVCADLEARGTLRARPLTAAESGAFANLNTRADLVRSLR